jgi:hypothetical protein
VALAPFMAVKNLIIYVIYLMKKTLAIFVHTDVCDKLTNLLLYLKIKKYVCR